MASERDPGKRAIPLHLLRIKKRNEEKKTSQLMVLQKSNDMTVYLHFLKCIQSGSVPGVDTMSRLLYGRAEPKPKEKSHAQ